MSDTPPAKRVRVVAPKGSVANNPFRMLPEELVAEIQAMKKFVLTPSAIAFHAAGLTWFNEPSPNVAMRVTTTRPAYFSARGYRTDYCEFYSNPGVDPEFIELGRVLTDAEEELRRMRLDPRMSGTRELHDVWLIVQREQAEASGMF